jgi:hypothetical protein
MTHSFAGELEFVPSMELVWKLADQTLCCFRLIVVLNDRFVGNSYVRVIQILRAARKINNTEIAQFAIAFGA